MDVFDAINTTTRAMRRRGEAPRAPAAEVMFDVMFREALGTNVRRGEHR